MRISNSRARLEVNSTASANLIIQRAHKLRKKAAKRCNINQSSLAWHHSSINRAFLALPAILSRTSINPPFSLIPEAWIIFKKKLKPQEHNTAKTNYPFTITSLRSYTGDEESNLAKSKHTQGVKEWLFLNSFVVFQISRWATFYPKESVSGFELVPAIAVESKCGESTQILGPSM